MGTNSASADQVRQILAETARRRQLWAQMQQIAREAFVAVAAVARRRGIRHQNWLGGVFDGQSVRVTFLTYESRLDKKLGVKHPRTAKHSFRLHGPGTVERPTRDDVYGGYPNLDEEDLDYFRDAAVAALMASLNTYTARRDRERRG